MRSLIIAKPPDQTPVSFPYRGATDRTPYIDTPGDSAPYGTIENVRPASALAGGRFRGGQRPGLRQQQDAAGNDWGRVGTGPIQRILGASVSPPVTDYAIGDRDETHLYYWSRVDDGNDDNLFLIGGLQSVPYQIQAITVPTYDMTGGESVTSLAWSSTTKLFGAVNSATWSATTVGENVLFDTVLDRASTYNRDGFYGTTEENAGTGETDGYTRQNDSTTSDYTDANYPDIAYRVISDLSGSPAFAQQPAEKVAAITVSSVDYLIAAVTKQSTASPATVANRDFGAIGVYVASTRLFIGTLPAAIPSCSVTGGSHAVAGFEGAYEVTGIKAYTVGSASYLYFCYRAGIQSESAIGRITLTNVSTVGLNQGSSANPGSGAFTVDGGSFGAGNESINYPRGHYPSDLAVDTDTGYVYYTCASAGYGWDASNPAHYPDADDSTPVTVCKVDPNPASSTYGFVWEVATDVNTAAETPVERSGNPELLCIETDGDMVYVGGRTVRANGKNVFGLDAATGGRVWEWYSSTAIDKKIFGIVLDPVDGNPIVCGDRSNTWSGNDSTYANVWKINKTDGTTIWGKDVGVARSALCMAINATTGILAVGTNHA